MVKIKGGDKERRTAVGLFMETNLAASLPHSKRILVHGLPSSVGSARSQSRSLPRNCCYLLSNAAANERVPWWRRGGMGLFEHGAMRSCCSITLCTATRYYCAWRLPC